MSTHIKNMPEDQLITVKAISWNKRPATDYDLSQVFPWFVFEEEEEEEEWFPVFTLQMQSKTKSRFPF